MSERGDWLRRLLADATPGPWVVRTGTYGDTGEDYVAGIDLGPHDFIETDGGCYGPEPRNARLIAKAPEIAEWAADARDALAALSVSVRDDERMEAVLTWRAFPLNALLARYDEIGGHE